MWYTAREASRLLDNEVTEATIKSYCRNQKVKCKRKGPRKEWCVLGAELTRLRREWGLDS